MYTEQFKCNFTSKLLDWKWCYSVWSCRVEEWRGLVLFPNTLEAHRIWNKVKAWVFRYTGLHEILNNSIVPHPTLNSIKGKSLGKVENTTKVIIIVKFKGAVTSIFTQFRGKKVNEREPVEKAKHS